ncbi:MAG TPA: hypothetical protein VGX03_23655 [Candidatus Binatia bacterium]|nr:hypothetical protein [Candidatus Binatia bacterium]
MELLREGYHERLFLLTDEHEGLIVRKQAKATSSTLLTEIVWLEELPPSLHRYFPCVLRSNKAKGNGQALFYDMPYFGHEWVLLSELILTQTLYRTQALTLISQVMQVMFESIFPTTYPEEESDYPEKLVRLLEGSTQQIAQLSAFSPLIQTEALLLNGKRTWNIFPLLELCKGEEQLRKKLRPAAIRKVHGDLYPENVLVHIPSLHQHAPRVMLLDPIAALGLSRGDFAMDAAKFTSWLSAELLALRLGLFSVQQEQSTLPAFTLTVHTGDTRLCARSDGVLLREFIALFETAEWARAVCDADPQWWQRMSFYEALYALSMVPLVPFPQSLARFLVGMQHLSDFVSTSEQQAALPGTSDVRLETCD